MGKIKLKLRNPVPKKFLENRARPDLTAGLGRLDTKDSILVDFC